MFEIRWNAVGNAVSYDVQRQFQGGSWSTIVNDTPFTAIDTYVTQSGTYTFRVRANRTVTYSGWSGTDSTFVFLGGWGGQGTATEPAGETTCRTAHR